MVGAGGDSGTSIALAGVEDGDERGLEGGMAVTEADVGGGLEGC